MTHLTVPLPESLNAFVEEQASKGGFQNPAAYVQALIQEAEEREARARLEKKLLANMRSGVCEMNDDDWAALERRVLDRLAEKNS